MESWETERQAALDRNSRFVEEFVEQLNICPYAKQSRLAGTAQRRVTSGAGDDLTANHPDVVAAFRAIEADPTLEVLQLICPRVALGGKEWTARVKDVTETLHRRHGSSVVGVAAFHPELSFRSETAAALVPVFRRGPDPTIQWIRLDVIERVRASRPAGDVAIPTTGGDLEEFLNRHRLPSVEAEISAANARLVDELGVDAVLCMLDGFRE
jgi:hypothetical protein